VITVTATVTVSHYDFDLAVTPDGKYVYVPQLDNVAVVSTATNTVMTNIDLKGAYQVAVTPNGKYAYVTGSVTGSVFPHVTTYFVAVIDTASNKVTATINLEGAATGIAITPDGEYVYVTESDIINNEGVGVVSVIRTANNTVAARVIVGSSPEAVAITPNGEYAYVLSDGTVTSLGGTASNGTASVINISNNTVMTVVIVEVGPQGVAITPNGEFAYVTNYGNNSVSVINTATNTVSKTITGLSYPYDVAISPNGEYALVTEQDFGNLTRFSVINTLTNAVTATVHLASIPYDLAITPNGAYAYIANGANSTFSVVSMGVDATPAASSPRATLEFSDESLIVIAFISITVVLAVIIIIKKNWKKINSTNKKIERS